MHGGKQPAIDRPSSNREALPPSAQLVKNHPGPLGTKYGLIDFVLEPQQQSPPNPPHCSLDQTNLIHDKLTKLLQKQAIQLVDQPAETGFLSNIFLVPKKDGGQRPVINLKALNQFVNTEHFKMEGIHTVKDLLRQGDWLAKVHLKDAYFAIPIHLTHRRYLKFQALGNQYHFTCLPFGLSSAPWVFTKTLKPVLALLREMGMRLVAYIDDILILAESKERALDHGTGMSGLYRQRREISARSESNHRISGPNDRHKQHGVVTSGTQNKTNSGGVSKVATGRDLVSSNPSTSIGENERICVCQPLFFIAIYRWRYPTR